MGAGVGGGGLMTTQNSSSTLSVSIFLFVLRRFRRRLLSVDVSFFSFVDGGGW